VARDLKREVRKPEKARLKQDPRRPPHPLPMIPPGKTCNARNRAVSQKTGRKAPYCGNEAGWGTSHLGTGRCKKHGGCQPVKSGFRRYSDHPTLGARIAAAMDSADILTLEPEVAVLQTLVEDALKEHIGEGHVADSTREAMSRMLLELGTLKEKAHRIRLAWSDRRAAEFLDWFSETLRRELQHAFGEDDRIASVILRMGAEADRVRV